MEQTLGKRIMENRKKLGLTQDQLAEQLGVTAQAVSKWENDQSCPDITMLPKLAEIFDISIDELLGRENRTPVHEAEIVHEEDSENDGVHVQKGNWEIHLDSSRRGAILFALLVLLVGALCLANTLLEWNVGFWSILWPSALLVFGIDGVLKNFSFFSLGCALFGGYFLVENLGFWELNVGSELIFPIIIVLFGLSLLVDALRKPKKSRFRIHHNGKNFSSGDSAPKSTITTEEHSFECNHAFGENTHYVEIPLLEAGNINSSFGELTVDLSGCEALSEDCEIEANCSFGQLTLAVPNKFRVEPNSRTAFGSVDTVGCPDPKPAGILHLDANVSFGEITIKYI